MRTCGAARSELRVGCSGAGARGGGPGVNKGIRSIVIVWGGYKCANFGATKHVYAWKFATALQGCAEFQASPRSAPSWNSSFLGPRTPALAPAALQLHSAPQSSIQNSGFSLLKRHAHAHNICHFVCSRTGTGHWGAPTAHSRARLSALSRPPGARPWLVSSCAHPPAVFVSVDLHSHTRVDVAPAAHMQHSYSPISSISQGGLRFMQPGHTP